MRIDKTKRFCALVLPGLLAIFSLQAQASVTFTFTETAGTVVMTSSGVLDTTRLVPSFLDDGWGGTGTEHNSTAGDIDIMGGTTFGEIDTQFGFSPGTDASAITNPGGPFSTSDFSVTSIAGSRSFTTYSGFDSNLRQAGIGIRAEDIDAGLWTPNQTWSYDSGTSFASLGLVPGFYPVSDIETGETIIIQIGAPPLPVPAMDIWALILLGAAVLLMGGLMMRRNFVT